VLLVVTCMAERPRMLVQLTLTGCGPCRHRCTVGLSPCSAASRKTRSCGSMRCPALSGSSGGGARDLASDFILSGTLDGDERRLAAAASDDDIERCCDGARSISGDGGVLRRDVTE